MTQNRAASFRHRVFAVVKNIPAGKTLSYKQVAQRAGHPKSFRAVGNMLNGNYDPDIPCHRVIRSDLPAPRPGIYFIYAILCNNQAIYIGQTQNLQNRWAQHLNSTASDYTKRYGAKKLIHYERYSTREKVVQREKWLKTGFGRKWLKREWKAGRTRQAGGTTGGYNRGNKEKIKKLRAEGALI